MISLMRFWFQTTTSNYAASKKIPDGDGWVEINFQQYCAAKHPNLYVYDIESYPNVFTITIMRPSDNAIWRYEISGRKNQGVELFQLLMQIKASNGRMVGFNNIGYDYTVLHEIIRLGGHIDAASIYNKSVSIIKSDDKFGSTIWDDDRFVDQIDLFKINHFDNKARATSLKMLEFNMMSQSIQDLPYEPGTYLSSDQIDELVIYNDHDVFETVKFLGESITMLEFRDELTAKYKRNFTNHNDTKIGKDYFIMELERAGVPCYHRPNGRKDPRQTVRPFIDLKDVIFPWIRFDSRPFQLVLDWLKNQRITSTKGVFEFLNVSPEMVEYMDHSLIRVHGLDERTAPGSTPKQREKGINLSKLDFDTLRDLPLQFVSGWKKKSGLNCKVNNFRYDFGTGGIHGSVESQIVESDDYNLIIDLDVASYYPNLAISNRLYPAHLSETFCDTYHDMYLQRAGFKKGTSQNAMLKLALNGVYGDSNNQYSPFYDPAYTMAITINGQLLLCLLAEHLSSIPNLKMIQVNTDGLTVRCPRQHIDTLMFIAKSWEQLTGLELERADYSRMMIRDVNNYIAEKIDGSLKRKGDYGYGKDLEWHRDHSAQIIAIAAEAALVRGIPIIQTVTQHAEFTDFLYRTKVPRSSRLMMRYDDSNKVQIQNITRYYISDKGGSLIKEMPPTPAQLAKDPNAPFRQISINAGQLVTECNNLSSYIPNKINYDYYVKEAEKLVTPLISGISL